LSRIDKWRTPQEIEVTSKKIASLDNLGLLRIDREHLPGVFNLSEATAERLEKQDHPSEY